MKKINLAITGCLGRMGQQLIKSCKKNKDFKLVIKGELSLGLLNSFMNLEVMREGNSLKLLKYEVIEKNFSKNN